MSSKRTRVILHHQARTIVAAVIEYFYLEKNNMGPILNVRKVLERAARACKVSYRTVRRISGELKETMKDVEDEDFPSARLDTSADDTEEEGTNPTPRKNPKQEPSTSGAVSCPGTDTSGVAPRPNGDSSDPVQPSVKPEVLVETENRASTKPHVPLQTDVRSIPTPPVDNVLTNPTLKPVCLPPLDSDISISVRWDKYASNMSSVIPSLLEDEKFVDVTLACDGKYIKCHKVILGACSPYFEELLSTNPCQHPIILMKDFCFWEIKAIVDFIYCGFVNIPQKNLANLLRVADALQIKGLTGTKTDDAPPVDCPSDSVSAGGRQPRRRRSGSAAAKTSQVPSKRFKLSSKSCSSQNSLQSHSSDESSNQSDVHHSAPAVTADLSTMLHSNVQHSTLAITVEPLSMLHSICFKEEPPNYDVDERSECHYGSDQIQTENNLGQFQPFTLPESQLVILQDSKAIKQEVSEEIIDMAERDPLDLESGVS